MTTCSSFKETAATFMESWPSGLAALSFPHRRIDLCNAELMALLAGPLACDPDTTAALDGLSARIAAVLHSFPKGAFLKLGSRSPKDVGGRRVFTAGQAILALRRSRRVFQDCETAARNQYLPVVFLREWVDIPAWSEIRCFMKERKLVGLCTYQGTTAVTTKPESASWEVIESAVREFATKFRALSHLGSVVFDVCYLEWERPNPIKLIEINPFGPQTDGILFSWWKPGDFDGSFRIAGDSA